MHLLVIQPDVGDFQVNIMPGRNQTSFYINYVVGNIQTPGSQAFLLTAEL
jgi:hypothetical protein